MDLACEVVIHNISSTEILRIRYVRVANELYA